MIFFISFVVLFRKGSLCQKTAPHISSARTGSHTYSEANQYPKDLNCCSRYYRLVYTVSLLTSFYCAFLQLILKIYKLHSPDSLAARERNEVRKGRYKLSILLVSISRGRVVLEWLNRHFFDCPFFVKWLKLLLFHSGLGLALFGFCL